MIALAAYFRPGPEAAAEGQLTRRGVCISSESFEVAHSFGPESEVMVKGHMD